MASSDQIYTDFIANTDKFDTLVNSQLTPYINGGVDTTWTDDDGATQPSRAKLDADFRDRANIQIDAAEQAATQAALSAQSTGPYKPYETKADATADLGNLSDGDIVEVWEDESNNGVTTRYTVSGGALTDPYEPYAASRIAYENGLTVGQYTPVPSVYDLLNSPFLQIAGLYVTLVSFYEAIGQKPEGGGGFVWCANQDKTSANGGTIIDPDTLAGFDGTPATRDAYLAAQGTGTGAGCWVRTEASDFPVEAFGAVGDSTGPNEGTDDHAAIQAAINTSAEPGGVIYGCRARLRAIQYRISKPLYFLRIGELIGVGANSGGRAASLICVDDNQIGAYFNHVSSYGNRARQQSDPDGRAEGYVMRGVCFKGGGTNSDAHGVVVKVRVGFENVRVSGFPGNGFHLDSPHGNANSWSYINCNAWGNGGHGFYFNGSDANAGSAVRCGANGNGGWGIYDDSFLGNTFTGCNCSGNEGGAFGCFSVNARTVFLGTYVEPGQPECYVDRHTIAIGGHITIPVNGPGTYISSLDTSLHNVVADNHLHSDDAAFIGRRAAASPVPQFEANNSTYNVGHGGRDSGMVCTVGGAMHNGEYVEKVENAWFMGGPGPLAYMSLSDGAGGQLNAFEARRDRVRTGGDNVSSLGDSSHRFTELFAANGAINTSDNREKQDIAELTDTEHRVAVACKGLIRKFRFRDAVAKKSDDARYHFGVIAQDVHDAFAAEGLDAADYGLWCKDTWREYNGQPVDVDENNQYIETVMQVDGEAVEPDADGEYPEGAVEIELVHDTTERTRLGIRYDELLAFVVSAL